MEAARLRQKAEELVKDNELLPPPSPSLGSFDPLAELTGKDSNVTAPPTAPVCPGDKPSPVQKPPSSGTSSEFEVVSAEEQNSPPESSSHANVMAPGTSAHYDSVLWVCGLPTLGRKKGQEGPGPWKTGRVKWGAQLDTGADGTCGCRALDAQLDTGADGICGCRALDAQQGAEPSALCSRALGPLPHEDGNLMLHLQRLETTLSVCAEEPDHSQLFTHLGRMALEFNRLASKVHKNEQRTSILQETPTLCEQLRKENEALKAKLDEGLEQRDQAAERLREENLELKKLLMSSGNKEGASGRPGSPKMEGAGKKMVAGQQQSFLADASVTAGKVPEVGALGAAEKKVKMLEQQRSEVKCSS
ncbi:TNFAIP3-interacting protein 1 [Saguinus oedipus]|uniref:TNFAIP3-interacting protein 1 n=1 Tax=Saguinus oedipus TaxID=9490 RepID=A0ABQ9W4T1_SAGOE|nr:TNFAIP3-interacting protein 1 [Saguinus oedipus]